MSQDFDIWVEKHRPPTLDGYVFKDENLKKTVQSWLDNPEGKKIPIPHILMAGKPGTGKTTLAKILINELNIHKADIMEFNASRERGIGTIRELISNFASTYSFGDYKIVFMDEADKLTTDAQDALKSEMEVFADSCRFIFTCNEIRKISPALKSRFQTFIFDALDMDNWVTRLVEVLSAENVTFDVDDLQPFIDAAYPDLRKCINLLDQHTVNKVLHPMKIEVSTSLNYLEDVAKLIQAGDITEARQLLISLIREGDYEDVFRWMYQNLDLWGDTELQKMNAIVIIAKGLRNHTVSADAEINISACLCELAMLRT
jgi:replication factor C small subunit